MDVIPIIVFLLSGFIVLAIGFILHITNVIKLSTFEILAVVTFVLWLAALGMTIILGVFTLMGTQ